MKRPLKARIHRSSQREFTCQLEDGKQVQAVALAKLLRSDYVVVGDYVELSRIDERAEWQIDKVYERSSEIYRVSVREQKKRITAANCDLLVIQSSVSKPDYKQGIVDRFLVRACQWGIRPIVVFNKMDQYDPEKMDLAFEAKRLETLGAKCFEVCALEQDAYKPTILSATWTDLKAELKDKTTIFLGQSGVGKSKMISGLSDGDVDLKTKAVGKVGKGSHTTTWSEIIDLKDFSLIDSPGIRSFSLEDIDPDELMMYFPDLEEVAVTCQFNNCQHLEKSKGCAFYSVDRSEEEQAFLNSRLRSYQRIYEETAKIPTWQKKI
jgi:ribosome biogenesis GTPase